MRLNVEETGKRWINAVLMLAGIALALMLFAPGAGAQSQPGDNKAGEPKPTPETYLTLYLTNLTQQSEINDFQTALRNVLSPKARVYAMMPENAITLRGTPEDIQLAQKILLDLDKAMSIYRLTYTIAESDGGKRVGTRRFAMVVATGQKVDFKQGSHVPLVTGVADATTSKSSSQVQYVDVGLQIEATVDRYEDGLRLHTKVEQSSLAEEKSGVGPQDPVIRQSMLEGTSTLELGKPLLLGSFDLPGGTRKQEVEVVAELIR